MCFSNKYLFEFVLVKRNQNYHFLKLQLYSIGIIEYISIRAFLGPTGTEQVAFGRPYSGEALRKTPWPFQGPSRLSYEYTKNIRILY